jgi:peroxiredoxin
MKKYFLATVILLSFAFQCKAQLPIGTEAPEIKLPDTSGKWKPLSSVKSNLILLDFWAAWCGPCIQSMPDIKRLYQTYHDKGLEVYAVSLDKDYYNWIGTCRRLELPFILVNEAYGMNGNSCHDYKVSSIPNKMLIKENKIIASNMSLYEIEKMIEKELE